MLWPLLHLYIIHCPLLGASLATLEVSAKPKQLNLSVVTVTVKMTEIAAL